MEEASRAAEISERAVSRVQDQKSQTDQVAAAITELEVSATEVARSTDGTKREVDLADDEARSGRQKVATTRRITEQLAGAMEEAVGITYKLGEFSNNIGSILDVIRSIAEQTNLLALNAAIEAARAGDALPWLRRGGRRGAGTGQPDPDLDRRDPGDDRESAELEQAGGGGDGAQSGADPQLCRADREMDAALQSIADRMSAIKAMADQAAHAAQEQISVSQGWPAISPASPRWPTRPNGKRGSSAAVKCWRIWSPSSSN